jgi:hypothetical protein
MEQSKAQSPKQGREQGMQTELRDRLFNPFRVARIGDVLPKVGPLGLGPTLGLSDSIPVGLQAVHKRKYLISRRLGWFCRFFSPFLSQKGLVSRGLRQKHGLFEFAK